MCVIILAEEGLPRAVMFEALLHRPHAVMYVSSYYCACPHTVVYVSSYCDIYMSSYYYIFVLIVILKRYAIALRLLHVSSYYYVFLTLHIYMSSYCYMYR